MNQEILAERYEIQEQLGKKAGRRTLLARDIVTDELVVVKLLTLGSDFEWDDLKLFEREAKTLQSLSHPEIPSYLDYFEVNSPKYTGFALVQTYISAQNLEQYIQAGRNFTEEEVKEIAKSVLKILIYLHGLNPTVIHRDLKPSNILLADRTGNSVGKVYLVDFGSVQTVLASHGGTQTVVGTYGYMPQEQFGGRAVPASDLYSLGATLIYLVTGTHPADLPQKDFRIQFEQLTHLSPDFTNWLNSLIEPNPVNRLQSAKEALKKLENPQTSSVNSHLTINQPEDSKIQLIKNKTELKFLIPYPINKAGYIFRTIISLLVISLFTMFNLPIFIIIVISIIIFPSIKKYRLFSNIFVEVIEMYINKNTIYCKEKENSENTKYYIPRSKTEEITFITYTREHFVVNKHKNKTTKIKAQLTIYISGKPYLVPYVESEAEVKWLAYEVSNWLGIPLTEVKVKDVNEN
ncbi:MAG TPA: serine/threonine-protein kinase [Nostocaceae cyanobacterium]|nr:serine/threonine-protein kinase [Nostocaceae cyanobacterium]